MGVGVRLARSSVAPELALARHRRSIAAIDVQTFEYAAGPKTFFTVDDGDVADRSSSRSTRWSRT